MELLSAILAVWRLWPAIVGVATGCLIAFVLHRVHPWFGVGTAFLLAFIGASIGVGWYASKVTYPATSRPVAPQPALSRPVAFLGIAAIGGLWSFLAVPLIDVPVAVGVLLIAPFVLRPVFATLVVRPVSLGQMAFATTALAFGFAVHHVVGFLGA